MRGRYNTRRKGPPILTWRTRALAAALLAAWVGPAGAAEVVIENIGLTSQGFPYVAYRLDRPFEGKALEGIRSGLPSTLTYTVELWQRRNGWWDRLEETRESQARVLRDLLNEEYVLITGEEVRRFRELDALTEVACAQRREYFQSLGAGRSYYVVVTANLAPLSVEDLRELESWLQGNLRSGDVSPREGVAGLSGTMVGMLLAWTGFGDDDVRARSITFVPEQLLRDLPAAPLARQSSASENSSAPDSGTAGTRP